MSKNNVVGEEGLEPPVSERADFNANLRPSTSLPCNFLFRYPVYALYTFMKFDLQLSSALFVIYRPTTFTELAGFSSNCFQFELHYHHFFLQSARLPVTGYSPNLKKLLLIALSIIMFIQESSEYFKFTIIDSCRNNTYDFI